MAPPVAARVGAGLVALAALTGCGGSRSHATNLETPGAGPATSAAPAGLRDAARASADPTVRGARLLPANLDEARTWGVDSGGSVRAVVAGLRLLSSPAGDITAATARLPASPSIVTELPERLGGGFVMALGTHLWRAPTWLGVATPVFTLSAPITDAIVGLDRVYVRAGQGPLVALDPRTGASLNLGPLPPSPRLASVAALDAWRALAVADLRGVLVTTDAGSTWRPVRLPLEPTRAVGGLDAFAVGGFDGNRTTQWWEVLPDGQASWLSAGPPSPPAIERRATTNVSAPLGGRPLQAAVEDGWPLTDGTALVARDGALVRVRLADGAVVETVSDAFSLKPARCHPFSLARAEEPTAFGFVCGETRGRTAVFRWDPAASRLVEVRQFESPREVLASGNGGLAVRGPCAAQTPAGDAAGAFCLMAPGGDWRDFRVTGAGVERARLVVLSNGRVALIRPPEDGDLSTARLTLTDGVSDQAPAIHLPLHTPPSRPEIVRALRLGVWMDGFEERRPGVLGGWVDAGGAVLGVEVGLDGEVRAGEYIRDAGEPIASGRWAFGWTASGGGFETTDGGMVWTKEIVLPAPIAEPRAGRERSCGPVGCVMAGWLRLGWGPAEATASPEPPPARARAPRRAPGLTMECEPIGREPPADAPAPPVAPVAAPPRARGVRPPTRLLPFSAATTVPTAALRPFAGRAAPALASGDLGLSSDASHLLDRAPRSRPIGRVFVWGPTAADWDTSGHWQTFWSWPWQPGSAGAEPRASAVIAAPWPSFEAAARALGTSLGPPPEWSIVPGDDPDHALLVERRVGLGGSSGPGGVLMIASLEADHAPVEARRLSGDSWPDLQGAVRTGGRWYVATSQASSEPAATVLWLLDGAVAREIGREPRVAPEFAGPARLARRAGGAAMSGGIGLLVSGPDADGAERGASTWVASFDPETHLFGDPELLAPVDLSNRTVGACTGDDGGWEVETTYPGTIELHVGSGWSTRLQGPLARVRVSRTAACIDDVFGSADAQGARAEEAIWRAPASRPASPPPGASRAGQPDAPPARTLHVTVATEHLRPNLRCRPAPL